jgi:hypothetical protein
MWCWRRRERISWTDHVKGRMLQILKEERKVDWSGRFLHRNCLLYHVTEEKQKGIEDEEEDVSSY